MILKALHFIKSVYSICSKRKFDRKLARDERRVHKV
jgi:hypothetical protein